MAVEIALVFVAACLLFVHFLRGHLGYKSSCDRLVSFPRVAPCLPIFGNALHLDMAKCHLALSRHRKTFGPVFTIRLFQEDILVLNDYASIHDALIVKGSDFAGRPPMYRTSHADRNKHSIVWQTHTPKLIYLRKSVLKSLRMYGTGLGKLEERCEPDVEWMCDRIASTMGRAFNPWGIIYDAVCSVMLSLTLGSRLDYASPSFQRIKQMSVLFNDIFSSGNARRLDFIPLLRFFHDDCYRRLQKALELRDEFWEEQLAVIKDSKVVTDSVVQNLLHEVNNNTDHSATTPPGNAGLKETPSSKQKGGHAADLSVTTVKEVFTNLILAGTDTTATALTCLLLTLLHYPDVQRRVQEEMDRVVGETGSPSLADRPAMPYLEAVLMELLRFISHVPLAVPHYTTCDTTVLDKPVPINTTVYINLWSLHHDETEWTDPWQFNPDRFLDAHGQLVPPSHPNRRKLLPFGAGRRVCLGEILAKNRLFLFATALLRRFRFEAEDAESLPEVDPRSYTMGLVLHPKPFSLRAVARNQERHLWNHSNGTR